MRAGSSSFKTRPTLPQTTKEPIRSSRATARNHEEAHTSKPFDTNKFKHNTSAQDPFTQAFDQLESTLSEQISLRSRILEADEADAETTAELNKIQTELEKIKMQIIQTSDTEKSKALQEELLVKNKILEVVQEAKKETMQLKKSLGDLMQQLNDKLKTDQSVCFIFYFKS